MADKYINSTGLLAIKQWIEGKFATLTGLNALSDKVDDIIAEGGEPNVIETIKLDGTALTPDAQKAVNIDLTATLAPYPSFEHETNYIGLTNADHSISFTKNSDDTVTLESSEMTPAPSPLATVAYVNANGGKIDVIKVNGTAQTITNKEVDLSVPELEFRKTENQVVIRGEDTNVIMTYNPSTQGAYTNGTYELMGFYTDETTIGEGAIIPTLGYLQNGIIPTAVSDLTNDSNFQTDTQVDAKIASAVASAVTLKGSVPTYADLPASGQKHGDLYDVLDTGRNYVWLVEEGTGRWDDYAGAMDMSAYWTSTAGQANTLEAMTVAEINAILEPSA